MEILMGLKKSLFFIILFFAFVCRAQDKSDNNENDKVIAKIGKDYLVTLKDLKEYAADWKYVTKYHAKSEDYKNALNGLIISQLKRFDFFDRRLNENQDLMNKIRRDINNELMNAYFDKKFLEKHTNEKMAAEAYKEMDKEIICYEIILPVPYDSTKKIHDSLKTIAIKLENGLSKNININRLIKSLSLKDITINNQKEVTWSESMIDPVGKVVFKLKIGYTHVIEAIDGFHIVRVLDIKKIKLEPFEKLKDEIISKLKKGYNEVSNNEFDQFRYGLIDKKSIKWNQSGLDQIVKWSGNLNLYAGAYKDTIQNALSKNNNFEILSYFKGKVDLKEYLRLLEEVIILNPNIVLNSVSAKDFICSLR